MASTPVRYVSWEQAWGAWRWVKRLFLAFNSCCAGPIGIRNLEITTQVGRTFTGIVSPNNLEPPSNVIPGLRESVSFDGPIDMITNYLAAN